MAQERLQKVLAAAGIASRRKAEKLISSGRVIVNGQLVTELGAKADIETDDIRVDGRRLRGPERPVYLLLNKPRGYVTTVSDPEGRPTVMNLIHGIHARIYPVGRLDYASEGLLLLTNDGALAQRLTHASSHVPKTYLVKVSGKPSGENIQRLRQGILLRREFRTGPVPGRRPSSAVKAVRTAPAKIALLGDAPNPWYEVTLIEGRTRQIRRMFEEIGHRVEKIKRVRYGPLTLDVEPGHFRALVPEEVRRLKLSAGLPPRESGQGRRTA